MLRTTNFRMITHQISIVFFRIFKIKM